MPENIEITRETVKEFFSSFRKRLTDFILPLVFILGAVGLFFGIIVPGVARIRSLRAERAELQEELDALEEKRKKLNSLSVQSSRLKEAYLLVETALPSEEEVPHLMTQLQRISQESGVILQSLRYSGRGEGGKEEGNLNKVRLQMKVLGDFPSVGTLLSNFEQASRVVGVDTLNLSTSSEEDKEASMSATLGVYSFFSPEVSKQTVDDPLTFSLGDEEFQKQLEKVRTLKEYEITVIEGNIGKDNPFIR